MQMSNPACQQLSHYLHHCLYFTAGSLARAVSRLADAAFAGTGLSPSHAFLLMLANHQPGITQKELCHALDLAPSTVTRFVDSLARQGLVSRQAQGKLSQVWPTAAGQALAEPIAQAWKRLYVRYSELLGEEEGRELTTRLDQAAERLDQR